MKKLIILLFFTISLFSQQNGKAGYGGAGYGGGGGSIENKSFWSCDYDGSPEYVYRTYVVSDSFLNMNGYERTLLPQSTMKIAFTLAYNGRDSLNTFTSAVDTAAGSLRRWIFHQDSIPNVLTGGKLVVSLKKSGIGGIKFDAGAVVGKKYYVKLNCRLQSGTVLNNISFTPTSEERTYEGTFISTGSTAFVILTTVANGSVYEFDNIEIREITNSVTNGTFADGTGWTAGANISITGGTAHFTGSSGSLYQSVSSIALGRRYVVTYQISSYTSGSIVARFGGSAVSGGIRTAAGVYSDTLFQTVSGNTNLIFDKDVDSSFTGEIDNVHLYEIPAYFAGNTTTNNHSVGWSKIDALPNTTSDTTSIKLIATASGDSVWQNIKLASGVNTFHGLEAGNKYTVEAWARGSGIRGANVIPDTAAYFSAPYGGVTYWSVSRGALTWNSGTEDATFTVNDAVGVQYIAKSTPLTTTKAYSIKFKAKSSNLTTSLNITYYTAYTNIVAIKNPALTTTYQNYEFQVIASSGVLLIPGTYLAAVGKEITYDNIVVQLLTKPILYVNAKDSGTKTSDTLSVIPTVFEKVVYNFTAVANTDTIKFWLNQADTVWIDSVNISQSFDEVISVWVYPRDITTEQSFVSDGGTAIGTVGYQLFVINGSTRFTIADQTVRINALGTALVANQWNFLTAVKREDSLLLYHNGVLINKAANTVGKLSNTSAFTIGATSSFAQKVNGLIGETRITRFDNIGLSTWTSAKPLAVYNAYTLGNGFQDDITGGGKKIVVWYDWLDATSNTTLLHDLSGNGYDLNPTTPGTVTTADQSRWKR